MNKTIWIFVALMVPQGPAFAQAVVTETEIVAAVEAFVHKELSGPLKEGTRIEVNTRWQGDVELESEGTTQVRVRRASSRPLRGPTVLRVGIDVEGKTQRMMSVTADIRHMRSVLIARRMLQRGEALVEEMFELDERDITALRHDYFGELATLQGMQTRRSLAVGSVLTGNHIEAIPIVSRGDKVQLIARTSRLSVSALGLAMQDGGIGERIRVKNSDSGKILYGQILDSCTIQIGL